MHILMDRWKPYHVTLVSGVTIHKDDLYLDLDNGSFNVLFGTSGVIDEATQSMLTDGYYRIADLTTSVINSLMKK